MQDVNVLLGPGLNIKRSPLCGRNFEYFSGDPYLSGKMAASYVKGIQSQGVYACPKHFAVNSQELRRMAMNSVLDERTLREIYLTGFEIAVKEGRAGSIMSSYNEVNGVYANENKHLLQDILRKEWGFDGIVITDWGRFQLRCQRCGSRIQSGNACSGTGFCKRDPEGPGRKKTDNGRAGCLCGGSSESSFYFKRQCKKQENVILPGGAPCAGKKAAEESAVLLKHRQHPSSEAGNKGCRNRRFSAVEPRYQGAGSSMVNPTKLETIDKVIKNYDLEVVGVSRGYQRSGKEDAATEKKSWILLQRRILFFTVLVWMNLASQRDWTVRI